MSKLEVIKKSNAADAEIETGHEQDLIGWESIMLHTVNNGNHGGLHLHGDGGHPMEMEAMEMEAIIT